MNRDVIVMVITIMCLPKLDRPKGGEAGSFRYGVKTGIMANWAFDLQAASVGQSAVSNRVLNVLAFI